MDTTATQRTDIAHRARRAAARLAQLTDKADIVHDHLTRAQDPREPLAAAYESAHALEDLVTMHDLITPDEIEAERAEDRRRRQARGEYASPCI